MLLNLQESSTRLERLKRPDTGQNETPESREVLGGCEFHDEARSLRHAVDFETPKAERTSATFGG
jgi:hypothetical protein